MKNGFLGYRSHAAMQHSVWQKAVEISKVGLILGIVISLAGCSIVEQFVPIRGGQQPAVTVIVQTVPPQAAVPTSDFFPESPTPEPTYTELPTYTPEPTQTPFPTYTPLPTYTLPPLYPSATFPIYEPAPVIYASPTSIYRDCCTLRVRNTGKKTFWIGTYLPYGGNYIKPGQYVEFYPHSPTWMRIYWCRFRYTTDYKKYEDDLWKSKNLYDCQHTDVYVNSSLETIGVK